MGELMQCYSCGATDATGASLTRKKGVVQCASCAAAQKHRSTGRQGLIMWAVIAAAALSWTTEAALPVRLMLTSLSLAWGAGAALTLVHESGHAIAALAMGIRVRAINLGAGGPQMAHLAIGTFTLRIFVIPAGGSTQFSPAKKIVRSRHIVAALAGPLVELTALVLVWRWRPDVWVLEVLRNHLLWLGALSIVINLIIPLPRRGNDIYSIWKLLTAPDQEIKATAGISEHDSLARRLNAHTAHVPMTDEELEDARSFLQNRLSLPGLTPEGRALESSNLAAVNCMIGTPDLLAEADELSAAACDALPLPEIEANRGSVLVALERYDEAIPLMERALPSLNQTSGDSTRAAMAVAALQTDDLYGGRKHLAAIRQPINAADYSKALELIGPAELGNLVSVYWRPDRSRADIATLITNDSKGLAPFIADGLERALDSMSDEQLADAAASAGTEIESATIRDLVTEVLAEMAG